MKKLILIRHAKTKQADKGEKDFDRKLTAEGVKDASIMGRFLYKQDLEIDKIISSSALRAKETAELIAEQIKFSIPKITYEDELYDASARSFLSLINRLNQEWSTVVIIGHNPTITFVTEYLSKREIGSMDSCSIVELHFENLEWNEISEGTGGFVSYDTPSQIRKENP